MQRTVDVDLPIERRLESVTSGLTTIRSSKLQGLWAGDSPRLLR
jgi:hypothetical protein